MHIGRNMKKIIAVIIFMLIAASAYAIRFEELDKPPEGAQKGQMLLGAFASIGAPYGKIIDAEKSFIQNSIYTFIGSFITKKIMIQHLSFSYGLFYEYMPIDYLGIKVKVRNSSYLQRSLFGSQYENWSRLIYTDFAIYAGPSVHVTSRKQWDISITPLAGYGYGKYTAAPIAATLVYTYWSGTSASQADPTLVYLFWKKRKQVLTTVILGTELNLNIFFSGGLLISFGCEWALNMLAFKNKFYVNNPQNFKWFFPNKKFSYLHSIGFIISTGYAFSN